MTASITFPFVTGLPVLNNWKQRKIRKNKCLKIVVTMSQKMLIE